MFNGEVYEKEKDAPLVLKYKREYDKFHLFSS